MTFFGPDLRNGLPIGLGSVAGFGTTPRPFSPLSLFAGGINGAWYDPSDPTTLFSDRAGTTPVGTPGQGSVVPVGLMLDKSQGLVLGSELVTNGGPGFTTTTGWTTSNATVSASGGKLVCTVTGAAPSVYWSLTTVIGTWYKVNIVWENVNATGPSILVNSTGGLSITTTNTDATIYFCAVATTTLVQMQLGNAGGTSTRIISLSTKTIAGNHAIAANDTTARPELRAVVNLLNGSATLATQSVTTVATTYTLYFTGSGSITLSGTATGTYAAGSSSVVCTAGTLTLTVSGTVTTADLRPANSGAQLPVYQARTDANTYDAVGFPRYLAANGTSSAMSTPGNVNLSGTDKVTVFAGVRALQASVQIINELGTDTNSVNGSYVLYKNNNGVGFASRGTAINDLNNSSGTTPPVSLVLAGQSNIAAPSISLRSNGAQVLSSTATQGTGNYGTYPLFIGARNNSSLFFNGNIYSLVVVGSAVSAGQISATEQWVAGKVGITI